MHGVHSSGTDSDVALEKRPTGQGNAAKLDVRLPQKYPATVNSENNASNTRTLQA